jgi:hypothetical protein
MSTENIQQTLDRILQELKSNDPTRCLSALEELGKLDNGSPAILREIERLAIHDSNEEVRNRASELLKTPIQRAVRQHINKMNREERLSILREIKKWEEDEVLDSARAEVIKQRYNFDISPAPVQPKPVAETRQGTLVNETGVAPEPAAAQPASAPQPRPSVMQTLLSESSVKIYLYLGAFFVIASALILAALVEAARLPILVAATLAFGGGAFLLRKRLPQPSFALFIVFSFLLPIDAIVLEQSIGLHEPALSIYWTIILLCMAFIWGFSIWFYESSFFSVVAFVALSLAFYRAAQVFQTEGELQILFVMLAALAALPGTTILNKWKGDKFSLPLFLFAQVQVGGLLVVSLALVLLHLFDSGLARGWWPVITLTWIIAATFFAASDILFPFLLFPWMTVAALLLLPWFFLNTFHPAQPAYSLGFWVWGAVFALVSEAAFRLERFRNYSWPLLAGSLLLFFTALLIAFDWNQPALTFIVLAGTTLVYTALHVLQPRWYVWSVALLSALAAYIVFFTLSTVEGLHIPALYQALGGSLLLTLPELLVRTPLTLQNQSRIPTLAFGLLVWVVCILGAFTDLQDPGRGAIVFLTFAILATLYAFHFQRAQIGYFATSAGILAVLFALEYFDRDLWLPALALISLLYYGIGFLLRRSDSASKAWGSVLINSGLILGALLSVTALLLQKETAGWYMILIALLFVAEIFARPLGWLEVAVEFLLSFSLVRILADFHPPNGLEHTIFGMSLIWLGGDLIFSRLIEKRMHRLITVAMGYFLVVAATFVLFVGLNDFTPVLYYFIYAAFFATYAFAQQAPRLGYLSTAFIPLATIKFYEVSNLEKWMFPLILLAVFYYAIGFVLRRAQKAKGWDITLLNSGLALGVLTSIGAPFQGGLEASIPIAIAATLFAVEAFVLRKVWWALPANLLYLLSYFVLLRELNVDEPQYYSIGAAILGMLMHYLLTRAGSKTGAFLMGMLSQLVLLGTTYIQMVSTSELRFFFVLFAQSLLVLIYGLIQRSRSLVVTPVAFAVLGVSTVVYSALKGLSSVILVGCTGIILLLLGIAAVLLRERITRLGEQLSDWRP